MSAPRHLLFPVETINRELDYRLALAVLAARDDNRIYIGLHDTLLRLARHLRGGVYLGKQVIRPHFPDALQDYHHLKERDFIILHFDTEGAVFPGDEPLWTKILQQRLDPRRLHAEDYVCTWGDFQRDVYRAMDPPCADNIRTTGHPRFDLYRRQWRDYYRPDAQQLRARYGSFILINTNLARANNQLGPQFVFSPYNGYLPHHLESRLQAIDEWAYKNEQLSHFVRLVHRLHTVFPDQRIILRPHPSEDPEFYRHAFGGLDTVDVIHDGPVAPWLLACQCMIHDGCTTGLEAHLGEVKIINFRPVDNPVQQLFLPNQFGVPCESVDEVVDCLVELIHVQDRRTSFDDPPLIDHRARRLLNNLCDDSFPSMLSVLDEAQDKVDEARGLPRLALRTEEGVVQAMERFKDLLRPLSPRHRRANAYARGKFPGLDPGDIDPRMERLQHLAGRRVNHRVISRALMVVDV